MISARLTLSAGPLVICMRKVSPTRAVIHARRNRQLVAIDWLLDLENLLQKCFQVHTLALDVELATQCNRLFLLLGDLDPFIKNQRLGGGPAVNPSLKIQTRLLNPRCT